MAKFIFKKDSDNVVEGVLSFIANDQSHIDNNKNWDESEFDIIDVSDDDFNNIKLGAKGIVSKNGTNVTYFDITYNYDSEEKLNTEISKVTERIDNWLLGNSSKPFASTVTNYKNYINSIDVSSITPLNTSLEKYVSDQGQTVVNLYELL